MYSILQKMSVTQQCNIPQTRLRFFFVNVTCSFLPSLASSKLTLILPPWLAAEVTLVFSLNFSPCLVRDRWMVLDISMSIPKPPTWPKNSTRVTSEPSRDQTDPCLSGVLETYVKSMINAKMTKVPHFRSYQELHLYIEKGEEKNSFDW